MAKQPAGKETRKQSKKTIAAKAAKEAKKTGTPVSANQK